MVLLYLITVLVLLFSITLCGLSFSLGLGQTAFFVVDVRSIIFSFSLSIIRFCVSLWAFYYLDSLLCFRNFYSLVLCFLVAMFGLVFAGNLLSLLVFWDLLGFTSFYLVLYYRSRASVSGALLTGFTNRLGDVLLLSFLCFYLIRGSTTTGCARFLLLLVGFTKSAQVPFSAWLPAAMVAPTPVSALVHSSTLVTAGVYLLYRFLPHYTHYLLFTGLLTTVIAGLSAIVETDIKKIVALSTLSQLGLIITCLGLQQRSLAFSHLVLHASFKALLFISVGIMIHSVYGSQSFRKMGTLVSSSWLVGCSFVISSLSLCGLVFISGWCTKESLLAAFYSSSTPYLLLVSFYLGFFLTLSYSFRLVYYSSSVYKSHVAGSGFSSVSASAKAPLGALICLSILQGSCLSPLDNLSCEILSSWVVWFYWGFWCLGAYFGMWVSQALQGINTALMPLYATSIGFASFAPPLSILLHTENTYLHMVFASS